MWEKISTILAGLTLLLAASSTVFASGFALIEQSVSSLGNAFAGGAANAEDASTIFFNPAGMILLEGKQVIAGAHVIVPSTKFTAKIATNVFGGSLGTNNSGNAGKAGVVPNLYYSQKMTEKLALGIGINAPFGLSTKYDKDWVGRYHAVESDLKTVNINPAFAYQATEKLTVGAGINIQYIDATLSSMADGGLVNMNLPAALGGPDALGLGAAGISNPAYDVLAENSADALNYGYNLGLLYQFSESTRLGLAYRSQIKHKLEGEVKTTVPAALAPIGVLFAEQNINGSITLPASASLSLYHRVNDKLALMGDISWTQWSSFDKLTINFEGFFGIAGQSNSTTTENWDDTWRYSVGATYKINDKLLLRTGIAYDETPISDGYRTPRIPGNDRLWVALGCGYQVLDNLGLDFAYTHLFVDDAKMEKSAVPGTEDESRGTVVGEFENSVDIASIQLNYKF